MWSADSTIHWCVTRRERVKQLWSTFQLKAFIAKNTHLWGVLSSKKQHSNSNFFQGLYIYIYLWFSVVITWPMVLFWKLTIIHYFVLFTLHYTSKFYISWLYVRNVAFMQNVSIQISCFVQIMNPFIARTPRTLVCALSVRDISNTVHCHTGWQYSVWLNIWASNKHNHLGMFLKISLKLWID